MRIGIARVVFPGAQCMQDVTTRERWPPSGVTYHLSQYVATLTAAVNLLGTRTKCRVHLLLLRRSSWGQHAASGSSRKPTGCGDGGIYSEVAQQNKPTSEGWTYKTAGIGVTQGTRQGRSGGWCPTCSPRLPLFHESLPSSSRYTWLAVLLLQHVSS